MLLLCFSAALDAVTHALDADANFMALLLVGAYISDRRKLLSKSVAEAFATANHGTSAHVIRLKF